MPSKSLAGKVICFTGTLAQKRTEATKQAEALGATVVASVTTKTDILVAGLGAGSKVEAAENKGVEIWDEAQFQECVATTGRSSKATASPKQAPSKKAAKAKGKRANVEEEAEDEAAKPEPSGKKAKAEKKEPITPVPVMWSQRYIVGPEGNFEDPEDVVDLFGEITANIETIIKNCEAMKDELDISAAYLYLNLRGLDLSLPDSIRILVNPKELLLPEDLSSALMLNTKNRKNSPTRFRQTRGDEIKIYYEKKSPAMLLGAAHADRFKLIWPCTTPQDVYELLNGCVCEYVDTVGHSNAYTNHHNFGMTTADLLSGKAMPPCGPF